MSLFRITTFVSSAVHVLTKQMLRPALIIPERGFRDKDVLKLRCDGCHFKKIDDRWWVLCEKHPRHKQRQNVIDERIKWVVTHITIGHRPFQKKEETYICNNCPPGPYDYKRKIFYKPKEELPKKYRVGLHRKMLIPPYLYEKFIQ
jgi:ribosomal protein L36